MSELTANSKPTVGVDLSADAVRSVLVEPDGKVRSMHEAPVDRSKPTVPQLVAHIEELRSVFEGHRAIGVAVPGLINRRSERVEYSAEFPEHSKVDIVAEIRAAAGMECTIENDANAAAYGEFRVGAGAGCSDMFFATLGTGIGGAFIFGGQIWEGTSGFAGEFGYVAINSDGMRLEDVASSVNIVRRTRSRIHQDNTSVLSGIDEEAITIRDIVNAAAKGDDFAVLMLERTGVYVGSAVASVINLLNIERIVIGGEIMRSGPVVLDAITRRAKELSFGPSYAAAEIVSGTLGDNAAAIGAALLAAERSSR